MKVVFAHDVVLRYDAESGKHYHELFNHRLWSRYSEVFGHLVVCCRTQSMDGRNADEGLQCEVNDRVSINPIPSLAGLSGLIFRRREGMRKLEESIQSADAVIVRLPSEIGRMAARIASRKGKIWAAEVVGHAWDAYWNHGHWMAKCAAPILTWKMKKTIKQAPYALYVTESFLQRHYPCPGITVACSDVETLALSEEELDRRFRTAKSHENPIKFGLIGSMTVQYKGIDTAIRALARLISAGRAEMQLRILGEGHSDRYRRLASRLGVEDHVRFDGVLPAGRSVQRWLDAVDVYLQPSLQEGLPRALVEAMGRGLPAIGSTAGGIPELLPPEWLIQPRDHRGLADRMAALAGSSDLREQLARRNLRKASSFEQGLLEERRFAFWRVIVQAAEARTSRKELHPQ